MILQWFVVFFPGGRLISLNKTSLEGVTFTDAAAILQNSPEEVELIVSQPKRKIRSMLSPLRAQPAKFIQPWKYSKNDCQSIIMCSIDTMQPIRVLLSFC